MYELFEHTADVGIRGFGKTIEESFQECAKAMYTIMIDLETVEPKKEIKIKCDGFDNESLLVEWLNKLLALIDIEEMVFNEFKVEIKNFKLTGIAYGEKLNQKKHHTKTEVKAATYSQVKVFQKNNQWISQCIVDV